MAAKKTRQSTKIPELKIVLDSNAIYSSSAHYLLTHEIFELIKESTKYHDIKTTWYLPEPVRHERQYQMSKRALELLPSVQKLERLLGHNLNITEKILEERVRDAIDKQIEDLSLNIISIDFAKVDWNKVMIGAAYRKAPFSSTEREKGFRDALISGH